MREIFSAGPSAKASVPNKQNPNVAARIAGFGPLNQTISSGIKRRERADEQIGRPKTENESTGAAEQREHKTFGKKLSHDARAASAKRKTDGDFFATRCAAREQHVGEIQARDEQGRRPPSQQQRHDLWTARRHPADCAHGSARDSCRLERLIFLFNWKRFFQIRGQTFK